ncbi:DUF1871 family protein [Butyrivibrio sp. MC2013]|uniref:DUF1871 family protein n=1 Tax=Butyrivibrio sp. MC2013 TaxID=1280686 RepID=UPI000688E5C1|nr:DUF1871 family protein [Butyrivibrio sp. MC2013]
MIDIDRIKQLFTENNITFTERKFSLFDNANLPDDIKRWIEIMGSTIQLDLTPYGSAGVYLYSQKELFEEYSDEHDKIIKDNNYFVIGFGPNGDLTCIDKADGKLAFIYHDTLWEETYTSFDELVEKTDLDLKDFLYLVLSGQKYPLDAFDAKDYMKIKQIINRWDPIDLLSHAPKDEYNFEILDIVDASNKLFKADELAAAINKIFTSSFDDAFSASMEECMEIAKEIKSR